MRNMESVSLLKAGVTAFLILICIALVSLSHFSRTVELKGIKYACTNSVDCLYVPTNDMVEEKKAPSEFLKNVVHEVAEEDFMPKSSARYMQMAGKLVNVGNSEIDKAKALRDEAGKDDEEVHKLNKRVIDVKANLRSKKAIFDWYNQQALEALKTSENQHQGLKNQEAKSARLSKEIRNQQDILHYVDSMKSRTIRHNSMYPLFHHRAIAKP